LINDGMVKTPFYLSLTESKSLDLLAVKSKDLDSVSKSILFSQLTKQLITVKSKDLDSVSESPIIQHQRF